jgi:hypothetical protein
MSLYLVSCDLGHRKEFGEYEYFHAELRKFRAKKLLQATWALRSSLHSEAIRDSLTKFVHADDRILVAEISATNWAAWKAMFEMKDL